MPDLHAIRRLLRASIFALGPLACTPGCFQPPDGTTASSQPGPVQVEVAIERAPGSALEVTPDGDWCGIHHLRFPVLVSFTTADGQLDERWPATLTAVRSDFARVSADVALEGLQGALQWHSSTPSVRLVRPTLNLSMTPAASAGVLSASTEASTASSASMPPGGGGRLLAWPLDSPCESASVAREPGEREAIYIDAIARAAAAAWVDTQDEEHALVITTADQVCESDYGEPGLSASVTVRSADGAVDLTLDAWFIRDGDQLEHDPPRQPALGASPAAFTERFGDFGLDFGGYDHIEIELAITLSTAGGDAVLRVVGYREDCQSLCDGQTCSGCGPQPRTVLLELSLSQRP